MQTGLGPKIVAPAMTPLGRRRRRAHLRQL